MTHTQGVCLVHISMNMPCRVELNEGQHRYVEGVVRDAVKAALREIEHDVAVDILKHPIGDKQWPSP